MNNVNEQRLAEQAAKLDQEFAAAAARIVATDPAFLQLGRLQQALVDEAATAARKRAAAASASAAAEASLLKGLDPAPHEAEATTKANAAATHAKRATALEGAIPAARVAADHAMRRALEEVRAKLFAETQAARNAASEDLSAAKAEPEARYYAASDRLGLLEKINTVGRALDGRRDGHACVEEAIRRVLYSAPVKAHEAPAIDPDPEKSMDRLVSRGDLRAVRRATNERSAGEAAELLGRLARHAAAK